MKVWLKVLLGILAGFGGGFAAGFYAHKKMNDVKFEEVSEEELDKLLWTIPDDVKEAAEQKKLAQTAPEPRIQEIPTEPDKLRNALQGKTPYIHMDDEKKKEYSKIWKTVKDYSNEDNANEMPLPLEDGLDPSFLESLSDDIPVDEKEETPIKEKPYQITLGQFYDERREYDKITIDWYDEDDVLLDEQEEVIADPESYVGMPMKELFKEAPMDGDPDQIFMRNDHYGTDYEVIRHHASYKKAIGGED